MNTENLINESEKENLIEQGESIYQNMLACKKTHDDMFMFERIYTSWVDNVINFLEKNNIKHFKSIFNKHFDYPRDTEDRWGFKSGEKIHSAEYEKNREVLLSLFKEQLKYLGEIEFKELKITEKKGENFFYKLPAGTKWENFIIKFLTKEKVLVDVMGYVEELEYGDMGFEDGRSKKPNLQWELLNILANNSGELKWGNSEANDKLKKIKERLGNQLQKFFNIDYDPFYPYKDHQSYRVKLTIIPLSKAVDIKEKEGIDEEVEKLFADHGDFDEATD